MNDTEAHIKEFAEGKGDQTRSYWLFDEFGVENCKIELIKDYPCNGREELEREEGIHIKSTNCVNKVIAGRTSQECRRDNAYIAFREKLYKELHPEKVKEWARRTYENRNDILSEKHLCSCGKY